ncbi:hypothetical protein ACJX0J_022299, partial [Zea mays]
LSTLKISILVKFCFMCLNSLNTIKNAVDRKDVLESPITEYNCEKYTIFAFVPEYVFSHLPELGHKIVHIGPLESSDAQTKHGRYAEWNSNRRD